MKNGSIIGAMISDLHFPSSLKSIDTECQLKSFRNIYGKNQDIHNLYPVFHPLF